MGGSDRCHDSLDQLDRVHCSSSMRPWNAGLRQPTDRIDSTDAGRRRLCSSNERAHSRPQPMEWHTRTRNRLQMSAGRLQRTQSTGLGQSRGCEALVLTCSIAPSWIPKRTPLDVGRSSAVSHWCGRVAPAQWSADVFAMWCGTYLGGCGVIASMYPLWAGESMQR